MEHGVNSPSWVSPSSSNKEFQKNRGKTAPKPHGSRGIMRNPFHPTLKNISQTLHVCHKYACIGVVLGVNVGIYGIHGVSGYFSLWTPPDIHNASLQTRTIRSGCPGLPYYCRVSKQDTQPGWSWNMLFFGWKKWKIINLCLPVFHYDHNKKNKHKSDQICGVSSTFHRRRPPSTSTLLTTRATAAAPPRKASDKAQQLGQAPPTQGRVVPTRWLKDQTPGPNTP